MKKWLIFSIVLWSPIIWGGFGFFVEDEPLATLSIKEESILTNKKEVKLLIWNIYKEGKRNFKESYKLFLEDSKPDILVLQEAVYPSGKDLCLTASDCYFSSAFYKGVKHFGVLTSSRFPVLEAKTLHSNKREPFLNTPKTSLVTIVETPSGSLLVINTHGINFVGLSAYEIQMQEIVDYAKSWDGPVIWAGDFNSWNSGRSKILEKATKDLRLKKIDLENDHLVKRFMGYSLDHVFTKDLDIVEARVVDTKASDHNPLILKINLSSSKTD